MSTLPPQTVNDFLETAKGSPCYEVFFTALYTGLRRGEVLGLRWCDVDVDLALLSVVQTIGELNTGEVIFREPKNKHSRRQIALSPSLAILMRKYRAKQEATRAMIGRPLAHDDLVFANPDGTPFRPRNVGRAFKKIVTSMG